MFHRPRRIDSTSRGVPLGSPAFSSHRRSRSVSVSSNSRPTMLAHQRTASELDIPPLPSLFIPPVLPANTVDGEGRTSSTRVFSPSIVKGCKDVAVATNKRELAAMLSKHKCSKYSSPRPEKTLLSPAMEQNVSSEELWHRRLAFLFRKPAPPAATPALDSPRSFDNLPLQTTAQDAGAKNSASVGMNDEIAAWTQDIAHRNSLRKSQSMGKLRRKPAPLVTDLPEEAYAPPSQLDNALAGINEMMRTLGFDMAEIPKPKDPYASIGSMLTPGPEDADSGPATHSRTRSDTTASLNTRRTRRTIVCHGHSKSLDEFRVAASGLDVVDDDGDSTCRLAIAAGILPRLLEPPPKTPVVVVPAPRLPSPTETPIISDWAEYLYSSSPEGQTSPPPILKELAPPSRPERAASIRKRGEALFHGHVEIEQRTTLGHVIPAQRDVSPVVSAFFTDQIWEPLPSPTVEEKVHPGRLLSVMESSFRGRLPSESVSEGSDRDGISIGSFDWEQSSNSSMSSMTSDEGSENSDDSGHSWLQSLKFSKKGRSSHSRKGSNASVKPELLDKQQAALDALLANFALPEDRTVKTKPAPIQISSIKSMENLRRTRKEASQTAYAHRKIPADVPGTPATARQE